MNPLRNVRRHHVSLLVDFRVLAAFHYGSLTRPSQNPPRIGLLSTVDLNTAGKLLCDDKHKAEREHEGYPSLSLTFFALVSVFYTIFVASDRGTRARFAPASQGYWGWGCTPCGGADCHEKRDRGKIYKRRRGGRADPFWCLDHCLGWFHDMDDMENHRVRWGSRYPMG